MSKFLLKKYRTAIIPIILLVVFWLSACTQPQITLTPVQPDLVATPSIVPATQTITPTKTPRSTSSPTPLPTSGDGQAYLWISSSVDIINRVVSIDPGNQNRIAYCSADGIATSEDGGESWTTVPIDGIRSAAEAIGYETFGNSPDVSNTCMYLSLDPAHPDSYFAVFTVAHEEFGAPPIFYMGFYTMDSGASWQLIPPPAGADFESFGGLWTNEKGRVEALYAKPEESITPAEPSYVQVTEDGGRTWNSKSLSCPQVGPCLRWGPAASNVPGMGSPLPQGILISLDGGETWLAVEPVVELRAQPPNQQVAFSPTEAQIITGSIFLSAAESPAQPLRETHDGGRTWQPVDLPQLPVPDSFPNYFPSLQILPDGRYLSQSDGGNEWFLLALESDSWCTVSTNKLPIYPTLLQGVGDRVWWVDADSGRAVSVEVAEITCIEN